MPLSPHEPPLQMAGDAQSALVVHVARQAPGPQRNGKHDCACGVTHAPAPSHVEPDVNTVVVAGHVESLHAVPGLYVWQAPPWHRPFVPQAGAPRSMHLSAGSGASLGTFVQVPSVPPSAHDVHAPAQAVSQQTPCAQKPVAHSVPAEHELPRALGPHELPLQTFFGVTQS